MNRQPNLNAESEIKNLIVRIGFFILEKAAKRSTNKLDDAIVKEAKRRYGR